MWIRQLSRNLLRKDNLYFNARKDKNIITALCKDALKRASKYLSNQYESNLQVDDNYAENSLANNINKQ